MARKPLSQLSPGSPSPRDPTSRPDHSVVGLHEFIKRYSREEFLVYLIQSTKRLENEIAEALRQHFGGHAQIARETNGLLKVRILSGYPSHTDLLTPEQINAGVVGGGHTQALNGCTFTVRAEKVEL